MLSPSAVGAGDDVPDVVQLGAVSHPSGGGLGEAGVEQVSPGWRLGPVRVGAHTGRRYTGDQPAVLPVTCGGQYGSQMGLMSGGQGIRRYEWV